VMKLNISGDYQVSRAEAVCTAYAGGNRCHEQYILNVIGPHVEYFAMRKCDFVCKLFPKFVNLGNCCVKNCKNVNGTW
jgi:hypothetical protein